MSTSGNQRLTRSASKARSTGGGSTGAASVGAASRARSRRGGSVAPLPEEDKPAVGAQVTRAYGTEGKSAEAQLLSAQIGMNQAVNPIANAVSRAQAPVTPITNAPGRLPALAEGPEDGEEGGQPPRNPSPTPSDRIRHRRLANDRIGRRPYSLDSSVNGLPAGAQNEPLGDVDNAPPGDVENEPPAQRTFFSRFFWGPRRNQFNAEDPDRTPTFMDQILRGHIADAIEPPIVGLPPQFRIIHWSSAVFMRDALLVMMFLFGMIWLWEGYRTRMFNIAEGAKDVNTSAPVFQYLHHRVTKIEHYLQDHPLRSKPADSAADKHQINWFTPGFHTGVDLYLSSPTASKCDPTWTPDGWPWSVFKSQPCPEVSVSKSHFAALTPWSDPVSDSWCAPPSNGKLQLTVVLCRNIAPTELVVEHAAMDEMPVGFMGSSPREVELWIHVPNDVTRATLLEAITLTHPSLLEDSSPQGKTLGDDQALPRSYVPVGRWQYDIWTKQDLQTFTVPLPLAQYGVSTNKVAVRVNSNWGNVDFTCLSRLRLYGEDASGEMEKLDVGTAS